MTELLGRPIKGSINHYSRKNFVEQHEPVEFIKALDNLLSAPGVEKVKWHQYTPYFNDGDACEFSIYDPSLWITGASRHVEDDVADFNQHTDWNYGDYDDGWLGSLTSYGPGETWKEKYDNSVYEVNGVDTSGIKDAFEAFIEEMPHHEFLLQETFGDPAEIIASKEGFEVEFYDHD